MITFFIKMLQLPNIDDMTTSRTYFASCGKSFVGDVMVKNHDIINFISKYLF